MSRKDPIAPRSSVECVWMAVRGHRLPPHPDEISGDNVAELRAKRRRPGPNRCWLTPPLRRMLREVVAGYCASRGANCLEVVAGPTCVYALIRKTGRLSLSAQPFRTIATKRAARMQDWKQTGPILTKQMGKCSVDESEIARLRATLEYLSDL